MPYTITVTRTDTVETTTREWVTLTEKDGEKKNGYGPAVHCVRNKETKVLEQTVEFLDLVSVIRAVNGIPAAPSAPIK